MPEGRHAGPQVPAVAGEGHSPGVHLGDGLQSRHVKVLATSTPAPLCKCHQDGVDAEDSQGVTGQSARG